MAEYMNWLSCHRRHLLKRIQTLNDILIECPLHGALTHFFHRHSHLHPFVFDLKSSSPLLLMPENSLRASVIYTNKSGRRRRAIKNLKRIVVFFGIPQSQTQFLIAKSVYDTSMSRDVMDRESNVSIIPVESRVKSPFIFHLNNTACSALNEANDLYLHTFA